MPRGIDPAPITSLNPADPTSKKGIENPAPAAAYVFGPGPLGRGISPTTNEIGGTLPR
jgi:hypothetical protein